jgi:uncharacterized protein
MPELFGAFAITFEIALILGGLALLWHLVLSPRARAERVAPRLVAWDAPPADFFLYLLMVMLGSILATTISGLAARYSALSGDTAAIVNTAAAQIGMLAGVFVYHRRLRPAPVTERMRPGFLTILKWGTLTFVVAMPLLSLTGFVWQELLQFSGIPIERQDLIGMFAHADSPVLLVVMLVLAIVMAPLTEELVFRAGLFRYLRTRLPRAAALLLPSLVFAGLHLNLASFAQLVVLAIVFSLAYERTGHIGTTIVAHALFNLNTIVLIFAGIGT